MRLLLALSLGAATAVGEEFHRAFTQLDDGAVCFDLPDTLAAKLDLPGIARRTLGPATFERPRAAQIEQRHFDPGNEAQLPFEAPIPPAAAARHWVLLSTQGVRRLRPVRLRGHLIFRTRTDWPSPPTRTAVPPTVRALACTAATRKNHPIDQPQPVPFNPANAAFVLESGWLWDSRPLEVDGGGNTVTTTYGGTKYLLTAPPAGQVTGAAAAILIDRPKRRPLVLVAWRGDETCLHRFSLHELGASGQAIDIATNCYDCDI